MSKGQSMCCPKCKRQHEVGDYGPRPELATKPLGGPMALASRKAGKMVLSGTPYCPSDVTCECGAILRHTVSIFKVSECGWECRIVDWSKEAVASN